MGRKIAIFVWLLSIGIVYSQKDTINYELGSMALVSYGGYAPFWLHTNQEGVVSHHPTSINLFAGIKKEVEKKKFNFDYGFEVKSVLQNDIEGSRVFFQNISFDARLYLLDFAAGVKPFVVGNQDVELSGGGLLFSSNARSMPRLSLGIDDYLVIPFTRKMIAVKGAFSNAWMTDNNYISGGMIQHKFIGLRLGGGKIPVSLNYEFHHAAQWGGVSPEFGDLGHGFHDFLNTFLSRPGSGVEMDKINAQGNHLGSQQLGADYQSDKLAISTYWQNIFEDSPIKAPWRAMNLPDGLFGVAVNLKHFKPIRKIVYEHLETTDQSGPLHDMDGLVFGGADNYFNNGVYRNGWSYYFRTIGTAFITSPCYNMTNSEPGIYNNRVKTNYLALVGRISDVDYKAMYAHSLNFGTYYIPVKSDNHAISFQAAKRLHSLWDIDLSVSLAADFGSQFGNNYGLMIQVSKKGLVLGSPKHDKKVKIETVF